jgi:hypothetical protein
MQYIMLTVFKGERTAQFSRVQMNIHVSKIADIYKELYGLHSETTIEKLRSLAASMLKRLAKQESKRKGEHTLNDWRLKTIPEFDSVNMQHLETHKMLMYTMFQASLFDSNRNVKISDEASKFFKKSKKPAIQENVVIEESLARLKSMETELSLPQSLLNNLVNYSKTVYPSIPDIVITQIIKTLPGNEENLNKLLDTKVKLYLQGAVIE